MPVFNLLSFVALLSFFLSECQLKDFFFPFDILFGAKCSHNLINLRRSVTHCFEVLTFQVSPPHQMQWRLKVQPTISIDAIQAGNVIFLREHYNPEPSQPKPRDQVDSHKIYFKHYIV